VTPYKKFETKNMSHYVSKNRRFTFHVISYHFINFCHFLSTFGFFSTKDCPVASTAEEKMILKPPDDGKDPKEWCEVWHFTWG